MHQIEAAVAIKMMSRAVQIVARQLERLNKAGSFFGVQDEADGLLVRIVVFDLGEPHACGEFAFELRVPKTFPASPPSVLARTPNGVYDYTMTSGSICTSIGIYHAKQEEGTTTGWRPTMGLDGFIENVALAMASSTADFRGIGIEIKPADIAQQLALASWSYNDRRSELDALRAALAACADKAFAALAAGTAWTALEPEQRVGASHALCRALAAARVAAKNSSSAKTSFARFVPDLEALLREAPWPARLLEAAGTVEAFLQAAQLIRKLDRWRAAPVDFGELGCSAVVAWSAPAFDCVCRLAEAIAAGDIPGTKQHRGRLAKFADGSPNDCAGTGASEAAAASASAAASSAASSAAPASAAASAPAPAPAPAATATTRGRGRRAAAP